MVMSLVFFGSFLMLFGRHWLFAVSAPALAHGGTGKASAGLRLRPFGGSVPTRARPRWRNSELWWINATAQYPDDVAPEWTIKTHPVGMQMLHAGQPLTLALPFAPHQLAVVVPAWRQDADDEPAQGLLADRSSDEAIMAVNAQGHTILVLLTESGSYVARFNNLSGEGVLFRDEDVGPPARLNKGLAVH